ncbi:hypothetical protein LZ30DRAFT_784164 [Colletotrichum cereale]|nr:hypothetical protein LZ30DRAFT_784164 [Colletotrichum cereale]
MKYFNLGLVALSSLFASTYAAPTNTGLDGLVSDAKVPALNTPEVPATQDVPVLAGLPVSDVVNTVNKRAQVVLTKVQYTVVEVKKNCGAINSRVGNQSIHVNIRLCGLN